MSGSFTYKELELDSARWYWNKQPLNLKGNACWRVEIWPAHLLQRFSTPAAVHQLDIQSRSQLVRFCEEDSRALEKAYRSALLFKKTWGSFQSSKHRMSAPLHDTEGKVSQLQQFYIIAHAYVSLAASLLLLIQGAC